MIFETNFVSPMRNPQMPLLRTEIKLVQWFHILILKKCLKLKIIA